MQALYAENQETDVAGYEWNELVARRAVGEATSTLLQGYRVDDDAWAFVYGDPQDGSRPFPAKQVIMTSGEVSLVSSFLMELNTV